MCLRIGFAQVTSNDVNFFAFFAPASVSVESLNTTKLSAVPGTCAAIVSNSKLSSGSGEYVATAEGSVVLVSQIVHLNVSSNTKSDSLWAVGMGQHVFMVPQQNCDQKCGSGGA
jgi:hypothetical protein